MKKNRNREETKLSSKRVGNDKSNEGIHATASSVLFSCTCDNRTKNFVTADIGFDVNLMDDKLHKEIIAEEGAVEIHDLNPPRIFDVAVQNSNTSESINIICQRMATMPVELHIRHGKTLEMRHVTWMVS